MIITKSSGLLAVIKKYLPFICDMLISFHHIGVPSEMDFFIGMIVSPYEMVLYDTMRIYLVIITV